MNFNFPSTIYKYIYLLEKFHVFNMACTISNKHTVHCARSHFRLDNLVKFILTLPVPQPAINIYHSRRTNLPIKS